MEANNSIHTSFNAKKLTPKEVARTFVPPEYFRSLANRNNSILVGPRGSGKTTLLKMLQIEAVENWSHPDVDNYYNGMDYSSVFIPMDEKWKDQLASIGNGELSKEHNEILGISTYNTTVFKEIIKTFIKRTQIRDENVVRKFKRIEITREQEKEVVEKIKKATHISDNTVSTFISFKHALSLRIIKIDELAFEICSTSIDEQENIIKSNRYLHLDLLRVAHYMIEVFDDIIGEEDHYWALCFDELELAPKYLLEKLYDAMRYSKDKLIYKFAISPAYEQDYNFFEQLRSNPKQDFEPIQLWYREKSDSINFCKRLWESVSLQKGLNEDSYSVLGPSYTNNHKDESYHPDTSNGKLIKKWYNLDKDFKTYIDEHNIDVNRLHLLSEETRAAHIRKYLPLLKYKDYFVRKNGDTSTSRPRNAEQFYCGQDSIFTLTEGNPRWFMAMMLPIIEKATSTKVTKQHQSTEILRANERFISMLKTFPLGNINTVPLFELITRIGNYFYTENALGKFKTDPNTTFYVDEKVPNKILNTLEVAYKVGAIIYLDKDEEFIKNKVINKRFRLNYLLAPSFKLPLRMNQRINLSTILNNKKENSEISTHSQQEIFHDNKRN